MAKAKCILLPLADYRKLRKTIRKLEEALDDIKSLENWLVDFNNEIVDEKIEIVPSHGNID